jgi:hypothetical protein
MSDPFDDELLRRLERLTGAIPVADRRVTRVPTSVRRGRRPWRIALAAVGMLLVLALGTTAAILERDRPSSGPGAFAAGGLLHCSGVDQLSPPDAAAWLQARDFAVRWQVEDRSAGSSVLQDDAPDGGHIVDVLALDDGSLLVLVDLSRSEPPAPRPCP